LLASAGSGMDQSSTRRKCTPVRYLGKGRLMGGRGVIFPGSYRGVGWSERWLCRAVILRTPHKRKNTVKPTLKIRSGPKLWIGAYLRSRLLNLDVRPPSHRQWSELRHIP
jgi:hypothetical protein